MIKLSPSCYGFNEKTTVAPLACTDSMLIIGTLVKKRKKSEIVGLQRSLNKITSSPCNKSSPWLVKQ